MIPVSLQRRFRILAAWCVLALTIGVAGALTATDATEVESGDDASATSVGPSGGTDGPPPSATAPVDDGGSAAPTTTPSSPPADDTPDEPATVPTGPTTSATTLVTGPDTSADPLRVTTPGTYTYDVSGTIDGQRFAGASTLSVSPADADGRQTHVQSGETGTTTTVYRHTAEGTYLESLAIGSAQGSFDLRAETAYLLLPADATAGTTTTGRLVGGGITADVTFEVESMGADESTAVLLVALSGRVSGFPVEGTMRSTIVARTADQLPVRTDARTDITAAGGLFSSTAQTRSELRR